MNIKCKKCQKNKDISEFHKNNKKQYGIDILCKQCHNELCRKYYHKKTKGLADPDLYKKQIYNMQKQKEKLCQK